MQYLIEKAYNSLLHKYLNGNIKYGEIPTTFKQKNINYRTGINRHLRFIFVTLCLFLRT